MSIKEYLSSLFECRIAVFMGAIWSCIATFLFPEETYLTTATAVLGMMALDLITKIYSLARTNKGLKHAISTHAISSCKFASGTTDKLLVFGAMLIICGCAYRITPISTLATWFMQMAFTLMFLRDVMSIIENLMDAGVGGLSMFKKVVQKKIDSIVDSGETGEASEQTQNSSPPQNIGI